MPDNQEMPPAADAQTVADYCKRRLSLADAKLSKEYFYASLPLCVIDSVFSIGVRYTSTRNVVIRYCERFRLPRIRPEANFPPSEKQHRVAEFVDSFEKLGTEEMTSRVFQSRQRTSPINGILKSEAVYKFAKVLLAHKIDDFQKLSEAAPWKELETDIKKITGQWSGISFNYFLMLAGNDNFIKPDRMIMRFLQDALDSRSLSIEDAQTLIANATHILQKEFFSLTPRLLDHTIWNYQRSQKVT